MKILCALAISKHSSISFSVTSFFKNFAAKTFLSANLSALKTSPNPPSPNLSPCLYSYVKLFLGIAFFFSSKEKGDGVLEEL